MRSGGRPTDLTPRQRSVLQLVGRGLSNREIGGRLGITEDGVKAHLSRLYLRFGVTNRVELLSATSTALAADREMSSFATLGTLRAIARRTDAQVHGLEATAARGDGGLAPRLAVVRDALRELDVALGLVSDLPPETTGPVVEALRKRLATAFGALDEAWQAMGAARTA